MIDGVIKYHVSHTQEQAPYFEEYDKLEALRARLFALGLIGETPDGIGFGNLSFRVDEGSFFITATQTGKQAQLLEDEYTFIESYDFDAFAVFSKGKLQPSSEALSHAMIYELHPDIQAVIHIHSAPLWHMMLKEQYLSTRAEYGTAEMVREISSLYAKHNPFEHHAFVMKGHEDGIVTFGRSIEEAELKLYQIIRAHLQAD